MHVTAKASRSYLSFAGRKIEFVGDCQEEPADCAIKRLLCQCDTERTDVPRVDDEDCIDTF